MDHMQIIETICKEVEHGFGKRLMAIPSELMESAPQSLLTITKEVIGRDILNSAEIGYVELTRRQKIYKTKTYRVFAFKDSTVQLNHDDALAFAERTRMRLLDKDETDWFYKNFDSLPMWKKSLGTNIRYWTSSIHLSYPSVAWLFYGYYGNVVNDNRSDTSGARCVGGE